jgi:subtilase family serine protease
VPGTQFFSAVQYFTPIDYETVPGGLVEPTAMDFNPTPTVSHGFGSGRATPDISADADPWTGYLVYCPSCGSPALEGSWGGTSFVAPQLNGAAAVIDSFLGHRTGFWNPLIYRLAMGPGSPFTPLGQTGTGNDNLYYTGTPGSVFNVGSGLGYPDLSKLAYELRGGFWPAP